MQTKKNSTQAAPSMGHPWALNSPVLSEETAPASASYQQVSHLLHWQKERVHDYLPGGCRDLLQGDLGICNQPSQLLCKKQYRGRGLCVCFQPRFLQAANVEVCTLKRA